MEQASTSAVIILAGQPSIGLVLLDFNVSFRAQTCLFMFLFSLSASSLWVEYSFMFTLSHIAILDSEYRRMVSTHVFVATILKMLF